jgi:hypothetical protein
MNFIRAWSECGFSLLSTAVARMAEQYYMNKVGTLGTMPVDQRNQDFLNIRADHPYRPR